MKFQEYQKELNEYVKTLCHLIYIDYREFFGVEDDLFLYQLSTLGSPILKFSDEKTEKKIVYSKYASKFPTIYCNPLHPSMLDKPQEEKINHIKTYLPFEIFSYLINTTKNVNNVEEKTLEFGQFLNHGLIEIITEEFALKHQIPITEQYKANKKMALELLAKIPEEIDKRKMIFQNDFLYMLDFYQIVTGSSLFEAYEQTIIKEEELAILENFVNKYIKEKEKIWEKIEESRNYSLAIEEITTYLIQNYKGKELEESMRELSTSLPNYNTKKVRPDKLERTKKSGFLMTSMIIASCIFLGVILSILIHK